jgi:hypothetical protein
MLRPVSHPYKTTGKTSVLYISMFMFVDSHLKTRGSAPNDQAFPWLRCASNSLFLSFSKIRIIISRMDGSSKHWNVRFVFSFRHLLASRSVAI